MNNFIAALFGGMTAFAVFGFALSFGDWAYTKYLNNKQRKEQNYETDI